MNQRAYLAALCFWEVKRSRSIERSNKIKILPISPVFWTDVDHRLLTTCAILSSKAKKNQLAVLASLNRQMSAQLLKVYRGRQLECRECRLLFSLIMTHMRMYRHRTQGGRYKYLENLKRLEHKLRHYHARLPWPLIKLIGNRCRARAFFSWKEVCYRWPWSLYELLVVFAQETKEVIYFELKRGCCHHFRRNLVERSINWTALKFCEHPGLRKVCGFAAKLYPSL